MESQTQSQSQPPAQLAGVPIPKRLGRFRVLALSLVFAVACSGGICSGLRTKPQGPVFDEFDAGSAEGVPGVCDGPGLRVLHTSAWPGSGIGLTIRVASAAGKPRRAVRAKNISVRVSDASELPASVHKTSVDGAYVLLLFDEPSDPVVANALRQAAAGFVRALPAGVQTALFRRCAATEQVVGFTAERDLVAQQLLAARPWCADTAATDARPGVRPNVSPDSRADIWTSLQVSVNEVARIGGRTEPARRAVVVIAPTLAGSPPAALAPAGDVQIIALVADGSSPPTAGAQDSGAIETVTWSAPADIGAGFAAVAARLARFSAGIYRLGICPPTLADNSRLHIATAGGATCVVSPPAPLKEQLALPCDRKRIARGHRNYPKRIEFAVDPEHRDDFVKYLTDEDTSDFRMQVQLGDAEPVPAWVHLRGQSSLSCARKSFSVNLRGRAPRPLLPGAANDEFLLISMCQDDGYFQQYTANLIARDLGLFPLRAGFVELVVNGVTWGVYLLVEDAEEALLADISRPRVIMRRRFDPDKVAPDVHYPNGAEPSDPGLASYWQLTAISRQNQGEALVSALSERMDLDGFLRWLAMHTLFSNGDYVDEAYFYAGESVRRGQSGHFYRVMAWDMDDLYSPCHHDNQYAMPDPAGLAFCAEGDLETTLLKDPLVYRRFVAVLEDLLHTRITEHTVEVALRKAAADLLPFFERADICEAMVELRAQDPDTIAPSVARTRIKDKMAQFRRQYRERRQQLLQRIDAYRQRQP